MKAYMFVGLLGIATTIIGVFAVVFNDKVVGAGLVTAGASDIALSVALAQGASTTGS